MKLPMRKRPAQRQRIAPRRNVGKTERWLSLAAGGAAVAEAARRRGTLGLLMGASGGYLLYRGASGHCAVYSRLQRSTARAQETGLLGTNEVRVHAKIVVDRPREMVYRYWRQLENLPRFMSHLKEVRQHANRSHWVARAPMGLKAEWDAQITQDSPNERLAWRSLPGSEIETRGEVHFRRASGGNGTELEVDLLYRLPGGKLGRWLGGVGDKRVRKDIERFQEMIEQQATPLPARTADLDQGLGRETVTPAHG